MPKVDNVNRLLGEITSNAHYLLAFISAVKFSSLLFINQVWFKTRPWQWQLANKLITAISLIHNTVAKQTDTKILVTNNNYY